MSSCLHLFVFMFMICVGGVGLFEDPVSTRVETRRDQLFAAKTELEFKRSCCLASLSPCPSDRDFDFPCLCTKAVECLSTICWKVQNVRLIICPQY